MSSTDGQGSDASRVSIVTDVDLEFEAVVIPVSDVDRAKEFYRDLGWRLDADFAFDNGFRVVQFTPPGSGSSVQFGTNITTAAPGSAQGLYLVVSNIGAAREALAVRGVRISDVFHPATPGAQFQPDGTSGRVGGASPDRTSYGSFATFSDPDGNGWLLQEVTTRLPGRLDAAETTFASSSHLASALRRAGQFSLFPQSNSTGNFQKVTQVVGVRIAFTNTAGQYLVPGMNVTAHIHKQTQP